LQLEGTNFYLCGRLEFSIVVGQKTTSLSDRYTIRSKHSDLN